MAYIPIPLKKRELEMIRNCSEENIEEGIRIVKRHLKKGLTDMELKQVRHTVVSLSSHFRNRWQQSGRHKDRFEKKYGAWLETTINVPSSLLRSDEEEEKRAAARANRTLPYEEKGLRAKQKLIAKISDAQFEHTEAILKATSRTMRQRGHADIADIILELTKNQERPAEIKHKIFDRPKGQEPFTPYEARTLLRDLSLTVDQYKGLRCKFRERGYKDIFPAYSLVERATPWSQPPQPKVRKLGTEDASTTAQIILVNSTDVQFQNSIDHDNNDEIQNSGESTSIWPGQTEDPLTVDPKSPTSLTSLPDPELYLSSNCHQNSPPVQSSTTDYRRATWNSRRKILPLVIPVTELRRLVVPFPTDLNLDKAILSKVHLYTTFTI